MTTSNDLLMAGGLKSASFPVIGTRVSGVIIGLPNPVPQTEFGTGKVKFWDDGTPRMQVVVHLATEERLPGVPGDTGRRALYVKGRMRIAVREAVRRAGASGLAVGGTLAVAYIGDGEPAVAGGRPPKHYDAEYVPPVNEANAALMADDPGPAATAPVGASAVPAGMPAVPVGASTVPAGMPAVPAGAAPLDAQRVLQALAARTAPPASTAVPALAAAAGTDAQVLARLGRLGPEVLAQLGLTALQP
ncbi:hypothetical protein ACFOWE_24575 [Planomonospora corallina]|uniref:Uncharacterized protein n=1 Tax=Planomonospora corallina TaxID=1806052 RepID=A0ABV8IBA6_9ACTN